MRLQPVAANSLRRVGCEGRAAEQRRCAGRRGLALELAQFSVFRNPGLGLGGPQCLQASEPALFRPSAESGSAAQCTIKSAGLQRSHYGMGLLLYKLFFCSMPRLLSEEPLRAIGQLQCAVDV